MLEKARRVTYVLNAVVKKPVKHYEPPVTPLPPLVIFHQVMYNFILPVLKQSKSILLKQLRTFTPDTKKVQ
jgi:hypothetical protein